MSRIIYGMNPVLETLSHSPDKVRAVYADSSRKVKLSPVLERVRDLDIVVEWIDRRELDKRCNSSSHQGVACLAADFDYTSVKDFLASDNETPRTIVVADQIEDPQNLGSMLRAMGAFGADLLVVGKRRSASVTPTVEKTASGAASLVPVARENALPAVLVQFQKAGYWVFGLEADGTTALPEQKLSGKVVLVVGSEGKGLSRLVRERCDVVCRIPGEGKISSLNAAQALVCGLYEIASQKKPSP